MRICFLTPEYPPHVGGTARSAQRLVKGLAQAGIEVVVITVAWPGQFPATFSTNGALVYRVPPVIGSLVNTINMEDDRQPFDIFHGFTLIAAYPCLNIASQRNRPILASIRGIDGLKFDSATDEVIRGSTWITSVSSDSLKRAMIVRDISECSSVIPNGIDLTHSPPHWRPTQTNSGVVGTIATFRPKKNIPLLIRAYSRLPTDIRKRLLLVGDAYYGNARSAAGRYNLLAVIEEVGIKTEVEITGYVDHGLLGEYHRRMRVFVLSSDHEGMPNSLLEAAASGVPIVSTAVDGVKDIFTNGKDALLVEPANLAQLTEAVQEVLTNEHLACQLSNEARATVAKLTREAELQKYIELYQILLK
jgi:glycosyltransferase involved in cell wall biosynthesis